MDKSLSECKINLDYLRDIKAKRQAEFYGSLICRDGLKAPIYNNVRVEPLGQLFRPFGYQEKDLLIDDTDYCALVSPRGDSGNGRFIKGSILYGGYIREVWGHFLMGSLARLWWLVENLQKEKVDKVVFFAENPRIEKLSGNFLEIMRLLGIEEKLLIVGNEPLEFECLIAPEICFEHDRFYSFECRKLFQFIREKALLESKSQGPLPKKIFLTRSQLKNANKTEINIETLDSLFANNGYEVLSPEKLSVIELIKIFDNAEEIASIWGSVAHNLAFLSGMEDKNVILVERHAMINTFQANINVMCGYSVTHVDAHWMPYMSSSTSHVFLYGATPRLKNFCRDRGLNLSLLERSEKKSARRRSLLLFKNSYRRYFGTAQTIGEWERDYSDCFAEAIIDTNQYFSPWLEQYLPLQWFDYFSPYFLYRLIKKYIKK